MDCRYFQVPLWTLWPSKSVPPQWAGLPLRWAVPYQLRTLGRWATRCSSNHRTAWRALWKPSWLSVPTTSCSTAEPQTPAGGTHPAYMVHINAHDYFQLGPLWSSFKPQTHQNHIQFHIFYTLWDVLNFSVIIIRIDCHFSSIYSSSVVSWCKQSQLCGLAPHL